jgi:UDP-3-O-[3-hydroxymyristoyl] glucosamine N-acyltransferase
MSDPIFFRPRGPISLADIAALTGAELAAGADPARTIENVKPLDLAGPRDLAFFDSARFREAFRASRAGACFVKAGQAEGARAGTALLLSQDPYRAYVTVARALFENELRPRSTFGARGVDPGASVHSEARLEDGVIVDPGAVVGPGAEIGSGTVIGANAVIGAEVRIGRDCSIGPGATVLNALSATG